MSSLTLKMKMSPKDAGVLFSKACRLEDENKKLKARIAELERPAIVPGGEKLVPLEASHNIEQAGCEAYMNADGPGTLWMHASSMGRAYEAMVAVAEQGE